MHGTLSRKLFTPAQAKEITAWLLGLHNKAQGESTNTAGGFLVPDALANAVAELRTEAGVARAIMQTVPMSSDVTRIARRVSGSTSYFVDEGAAITESQASFDQVTLSTKKIASLVRSSTELVDDAPAFANFIATEIVFNLGAKLDETAFAGDGTSTYKGILGLKNALLGLDGAVTAPTANADTWAELLVADFTAVIGTLPTRFHTNARWLMSPIAWSLACIRLAAATGLPLEQDGQKAFLGYPVVLSSQMPAGTSTTDYTGLLMLALGDFSKAGMLGVRRDINLFASKGRYLEYDQIAWRATARFDSVWHGLGDASNAGAVVGLVGS